MLRLDKPGRGSRPPGLRISRTRRLRRAFGAVSFELLTDSAAHDELASWEPRFALAHDDPRMIADAVCAVSVDASLGESSYASLDECSGASGASLDAGLRYERQPGGRVSILGRGVSAELERTAPSRYAVSARIAPDQGGVQALMHGVSSAIVYEEGGAVLRAAAVELDGSCVLYVGPSGGSVALDHVALVPRERGALAWGLPASVVAATALANDVVLPAAALLRVQHAPQLLEPVLSRASRADALSIMRESLQCGDASADAEARYLAAAQALCTRVPVGSITSVPGASHSALVRETLARWSGR